MMRSSRLRLSVLLLAGAALGACQVGTQSSAGNATDSNAMDAAADEMIDVNAADMGMEAANAAEAAEAPAERESRYSTGPEGPVVPPPPPPRPQR